MAIDFERMTHAGIQTLIPYSPGKSIELLQKEKGVRNAIKLASNENPRGCSPKALAAIKAIEPIAVATYPSPLNHPLMEKLSVKLNVSEDALFLSNGSDVIFGQLINCFALHQKKHILTHQYAFSTYAIQAKTIGVPTVTVKVDEDWVVNVERICQTVKEDTALVFLANPNNPTGLLIPPKDVQYLLNNVPKSTLVVLDEAYFEYSEEYFKENTINWLLEYPNLIITRTFSKIYGLAGLRLGYAIANPTVIKLLKRVQLPFFVNQVALNAAFDALDDTVFIEETLRLNKQGMATLEQGFKALPIKYFPSTGNFLTIDCMTDAKPLYEFLENHGVIVRPLTAYQMPNHLRVTIGTPEQNKRFLEVLTEFF